MCLLSFIDGDFAQNLLRGKALFQNISEQNASSEVNTTSGATISIGTASMAANMTATSLLTAVGSKILAKSCYWASTVDMLITCTDDTVRLHKDAIAQNLARKGIQRLELA